MESLLAADPASVYGRLADWLIDANEEDIARFWAGYREGKRTNDVTDLVFLNWSRINPRGAIAAVAGTADEHYAWWAWSCHDPRASLEAAIAAGPDRINNVAWGIGEFHPQWFRDHFDEIPESGRSNAFRGMMKWSDGENPAESLDFMKKHGIPFDENTFRDLVRQDAWAAQDWLENHGPRMDIRFASAGQPVEVLISTLSSERPEDLEKMAARMPPGDMKRRMEQALFEKLLESDPDLALKEARKMELPMILAERLSLVGMHLLRSDADAAFRMAEEVLSAGGDLDYQTKVEYKGGSTSWGYGNNKSLELMDALYARDPARSLDLLVRQSSGDESSNIYSTYAQRWVSEDLPGFAEWSLEQSNPTVRGNAAMMIGSRLASQGAYTEAVEWALSTDPDIANLGGVLYQWGSADANAAEEWLRSADLPEDKKTRYFGLIKRGRDR